MTNTAAAVRFDDRTRFNWGFFDAQQDVRAGRAAPEWLGRVPSPYAEGYCRGRALAEQGTYQDTSEPAWEAYIAEAGSELATDPRERALPPPGRS